MSLNTENIFRRRFLATIPAVIGFAGCMSNEKLVGVRKIEFMNTLTEAVDASITVWRGGELIFDSIVTIGPAPSEQEIRAKLFVKDWMGEREKYEIEVSTSIAGEKISARSKSGSTINDPGNTKCVDVLVLIKKGRIEIAHGYNDTCKYS